MNETTDCAGEEVRILERLRACLDRARAAVACDATDLKTGIAALNQLRSGCAEDINQLQHAAGVLAAAKFLYDKQPDADDLKWYWHPYQTGSIEEPDLRVVRGGDIAISAEVTTSTKPDGKIAERMRDTLAKLQKMPGDRFYFVFSPQMQKRAETKIHKAGHDISVIAI